MIYFYLSISTFLIYTFLKYKESFFLLKKSKYNSKKYLEEIKKKKYFINKELIIIVLIIIAFNFDLKTIEIATVIVYTVLALLKQKDHIKLKKDKKIISRIAFISLLFILLNVWFIIDYNSYHSAKGLIFDNSSLYYIILYLFTYFSYYITLLVNIVMKKFDVLIK